MRRKHKDELFEIVFSDKPEMGAVMISDEGISVMLVSRPKKEGPNYVVKALVTNIPEDSNIVVDIDWVEEDMPIGYPVIFGGAIWVKTGSHKSILKAYDPTITA